MNAKAKGTIAESAVASYLSTWGWLAERRALSGAFDKGDIVGVPGVVVEVKSAARLCIPEWMRETAVETVNASANVGLLVIKPKGVGYANVAQWWCVQPFAQAVNLLKQAGY